MIHSGNFRASGLLYVLALLCMTFLTNACMKVPTFVCHPNYFNAMGKEAIGKEIIRLETTMYQETENSRKSAANFQLALLYAHYNNPTPDYPLSLSMFEKYLLSNPDSPKKDEALYMKNLLEELIETDMERKQMENKAAMLKQSNQNLQDTIDRLRLLDLRLEKKRLNIK